MMLFRCDRCKKEYQNIDDINVFSFGLWVPPHNNNKSYDLCKECARKVEEFITNGSTGNENNRCR